MKVSADCRCRLSALIEVCGWKRRESSGTGWDAEALRQAEGKVPERRLLTLGRTIDVVRLRKWFIRNDGGAWGADWEV